jgi:DNA-binding SARP family transcriptional activator
MLAQNRSSLFNYAVSSLTPEIFSHPVWLRFGKGNTSLNYQIADELCSAAKNIQNEEPGVACQILLLCVLCQNNATHYMDAIRTIQQVQVLAQCASLTKEMIWAKWGEAAIYIHQGNYEQACASLVDLQAALTKQNDWMLAGFIDILRQDLCPSHANNNENSSHLAHDQQSAELVTFTFDWLQQWGCSVDSSGSEEDNFSHPLRGRQTTHTASLRSFFSIQKWQGRWQSFKLAIQAELKLQSTTKHVQPVKEPVPVWNTGVNSQEPFPLVQNLDRQAKVADAPTQNIVLFPSREEDSPSNIPVPKRKPVSSNGKVDKKRHLKQDNRTILVAVHMLGDFALTIGDKSVKMASSKGLTLLKYLLLQHTRTIPRDVLMDIFWPDAGVETARNNLNVAMHSLRKSLRETVSLPVIKFEDGTYGLEPNLQLWLDIDEFQKCVTVGQQLEDRDKLIEAVAEYEAAISLYQGDLLEQNPYEEWTVLDRERLRIVYLETLDRLSQIYFSQERYTACRTVCQLILVRDRCREDAHCLLMRCYSRQGQNHLALRQYQICVEVLKKELDVEPMADTTELYNHIRNRERI